MKTKHTKGEWVVYDSIPNQNQNLRIKTNQLLSIGVYPAEDGHERAIPLLVAVCGHKDNEQSKANAKLIAAAPDLLNAVQLLLIAINHDEIKVFPNSDNCTDYIKILESAIKKATE